MGVGCSAVVALLILLTFTKPEFDGRKGGVAGVQKKHLSMAARG